MKNYFSVSNGVLSIDDKKIVLPFSIRAIELVNNLLIVLLDPPNDIVFHRNVFAVNLDGEIVWQIAESPHGGDRAKPYLSLSVDGAGGVSAENWIGVRYQINLSDGSVAAKSFNRF